MITTQKVYTRLYEFFKLHIGRNNGVTRKQIFTHIFGTPKDYTPEQQYYLWEKRIKPAIYRLRTHSDCFIGTEVLLSASHRSVLFFAVASKRDMDGYIEFLERRRTQFKDRISLAQEFVKAKKWQSYLTPRFKTSFGHVSFAVSKRAKTKKVVKNASVSV